MYKNILKGIIFSYIFTFISFILFSIILCTTNLSDSYMNGTILVISIISILFGSAYSTKSASSKGLFWGSIVGLSYSMVLYFLSSILLVGFASPLSTLYLILSSIFFGAVGGIIGINLKK